MRIWQQCFVICIANWLFMLIVGVAALAQPANATADADQSPAYQGVRAVRADLVNHSYSRSVSCSGCHSGQGDFPADVYNRVCLTEYPIWNHADLHSHAYTSLESEHGMRIGQLLGKKVTNLETGCVQCHSTTAHQPREGNDPLLGQTVVEEAVGCEACHGPSSNWLSDHFKPDVWQVKSMEEKTRAGWINVRSPVTRAEECVSCHLGSDAHGRAITHEMYAAGHPPLAGFELETFADRMPRHWRYAYEKSTGASRFERTRNVLVAAVVSMRMAAELAASDAAAPPQTARWPEFARFDCFACHHELESPGWRQVRRQVGVPGRPALIVGCLPLVYVAATVAEGASAEEKLGVIIQQLQTPFEASPFGDPAKVAHQAQAASTWCRFIEQRLEIRDLTPASARDVLRRITAQAAEEHRDYDTARQLLGAWLIVYGELDACGELQLSDGERRRIDELLNNFNAQFPQLAEPGLIALTCGSDPPEKRDYNQHLGQQYKNRIEYQPQPFKEMMGELASLLPE